MVGMGSFSLSPLAAAAADSNMRFLRGRGGYVIGRIRGGNRLSRNPGFRGRGDRFLRASRQRRGRLGVQRTAGDAFRSRAGRKNRLLFPDLQVGNFLLDLRLELV